MLFSFNIRSALRISLLVIGFSSILAGCGGGGESSAMNTDTTSSTPIATTPTTTVPPNSTPSAAQLPNCPTASAALRDITSIQGAGLASPLIGQTVSTRGIVVGDYQNSMQLSGFFIQQATPDGDPNTSEGLFIFSPGAQDVAVGQYVQVVGTVSELGASSITATNSLTQLGSVTQIDVCGTTTLPAPVTISLPVTSTATLEKYEGMLVRFTDTLTVTEVFELGRFGSVALSATGRQFNPTNGNSTATAVQNQLARIILDDASNQQNPNPIPFLSAADASGTRRVGDTVQNLTGVLSYGFGAYRMQPVGTPSFVTSNAREVTPPAVSGSLKVASFNVLNYFTTLNSRGANSAAELVRQRDKIVTALAAMDADIVGLIEIENNGDTAITDLVNALNAKVGAGTYAALMAGSVGGDQIKVDMIYKTARVQKVGDPALPTGADLVPFSGSNSNRPPLAQRFAAVAGGESFWFVINHFKSKGSCPTSGDTDQGQGCWNLLRTQQANALNGFVNTLRSGGEADVLMMGDFNSYLLEDPPKALEAAGHENLLKRVPVAQRYTYVFSGESGALDQAYATESMKAQVIDIKVWHINSDEPIALDYNTEFKTDDRYAPTAFRSSDHDPVIVGLTLKGTCTSNCNTSTVANLFFSEYVEGSSNNKALEIYNPGTAAVDLSQYSIKTYFNGNSTAGASLPLTGSLGPGAAYVVAHTSGTTTLTMKANITVNGSVVNFNGDDAITLEKSGTVIDRIGQVGADPGTAWSSGGVSTMDKTLRRKPAVKTGDAQASAAFDPAAQWDALDTNTFTGLGSHNVSP
jgi:uncharacterized protein